MANHLSLKTPNREKHTYFSIIFIYFQSEKRWRGASLIKRIKIGGKALKKKFPLYFFNNFHIIFFSFLPQSVWFWFWWSRWWWWLWWVGGTHRRNWKCSISLFKRKFWKRTISKQVSKTQSMLATKTLFIMCVYATSDQTPFYWEIPKTQTQLHCRPKILWHPI